MMGDQHRRRRARQAHAVGSAAAWRRSFLAFEKLEDRHLLAGDITIYAAGETGEESMALLIDGATVKTWTNVAGNPANRQFLPFTFSAGESLTPDRIRVAFTNDDYVDGVKDRNLVVDKIVIDAVTYETEAPTVYSTGSWLPEDGIVAGFRQSEVLNGNGYFQYAVGAPGGGSTIQILAAGSTGQENMSLLVDGSQVAAWTAIGGNPDARQFQEFIYRSSTKLSADQIRVAFTNDYYVEGVTDRNLVVDKIIVDGVNFETEAPTVYSTGSWLPADGVTPGYRQSEVLNADGYFQYAGTSSSNGSLIQVFAAGSTGSENMSLLIDGVEVSAWTSVGGSADNGVFQEFVYRAATKLRANQIRVAFTNDLYQPPLDNNLRVDCIVVDGVRYESESPATYSTGTYVAEKGQVFAGYWQSEWLQSNGYFQYDSFVSKPGAFGLDSSLIAAREGAGASAIVTVLRSGGSDGTVSIDYKLNQGTALAGSDYQTSTGTLVFAPGVIRQTISIPLVNDAIVESPETFNVVIENPKGGASLLAPRTGTITITDDDLVLPNYSSFPSSSGLKLNGNATINTGSLQLTPNEASRRGTAFFTQAVPIHSENSFQTQFQMQTAGSTNGGEGLTFIVQNDSRKASAAGGVGAGLGYSGITNSLAVEFDTVKQSGEVDANHISVWTNGAMTTSLVTQPIPLDFNSGQAVNVWIDYNGESDHLAIFVSSTTTKPDAPAVTATVDLAALVGSQAYFGFGAATTTKTNAHRINKWTMNMDRPASGAVTTPTSLINQTLVAGLNLPTSVRFDPTGRTMYIAEKAGRIVVVRDGVTQAAPFIDISEQTNSAADRGLLDIALHPDFPATPYVYLLYTVDPPEVYQQPGDDYAAPDAPGNRAGRLIRVTADAATNYTTAVPGSQVILLGKNSTWQNFNGFIDGTVDISAPQGGVDASGNYIQDFIASDSQSHTVASLAFAPDGALLVAIGDGASYNTVDPRGVRVQSIDSLSGKILRINPLDGRGYPDNPFTDGNLDSNRSKVYQLGLRNPFRISVDPNSGRLFVGDVGWTHWEEIDSGPAGANFGWPYYEGGSGTNLRTPDYELLPEAQAFYASGQPVTPSLLALNHGADGINAIVMGDYYSADVYPEQFRNSIFFNDLGQGIVRAAKVGANGQITAMQTFATGAQYVVQITQGPDGNLVYVDLDDGIIGRWQFVADANPAATSTSTNLAATAPTSSSLAASNLTASSSDAAALMPPSSPPPTEDAVGQLAPPLDQKAPQTVGEARPTAQVRKSLLLPVAKAASSARPGRTDQASSATRAYSDTELSQPASEATQDAAPAPQLGSKPWFRWDQ